MGKAKYYHQLFGSLPFEKNFDSKAWQKWFHGQVWTSIEISVAYVVIIFLMVILMKDRKPFDLKWPMVIWNACLAAFSLLGTLRVAPEFISTLFNKGFYASVCERSFAQEPEVVCWICLFVLSKVLELGDTAFIVLRKQKLIKLHWIHHALTLVYGFVVFHDLPAVSRWLVCMNFFIHTNMYSYYALKSLKLRLPKLISITITIAQILQMVAGFSVNVMSYYYIHTQEKCEVSRNSSVMGVLLYFLYLILFVNFFFHAYLARTKQPKTKQH